MRSTLLRESRYRLVDACDLVDEVAKMLECETDLKLLSKTLGDMAGQLDQITDRLSELQEATDAEGTNR